MEEVGIARSIDADSRLDSLKEVFLFLPPFFPFPFIHILSFSPTFFFVLIRLRYSLCLIRIAVSTKENCSEQKSGTLVRPTVRIYFLIRAFLRKHWQRPHSLKTAKVLFLRSSWLHYYRLCVSFTFLSFVLQSRNTQQESIILLFQCLHFDVLILVICTRILYTYRLTYRTEIVTHTNIILEKK